MPAVKNIENIKRKKEFLFFFKKNAATKLLMPGGYKSSYIRKKLQLKVRTLRRDVSPPGNKRLQKLSKPQIKSHVFLISQFNGNGT